MVNGFNKADLMCKAWEYMDDERYKAIQISIFNEFKENFTCPFCGGKHIELTWGCGEHSVEIGDEFEYIAFRELKCSECNHFFTIEFPIDED